MEKFIIWGSGGHAREVLHLCEQLNLDVIGFLDERPEMKGKIVNGIPVLGDIDAIPNLKGEVEIICSGVGDPLLRKKFVRKTVEAKFKIADSLIHPTVYISKHNKIGIGSVICEGVILTTNIEIGDFVIINRGANISHDDKIGNYVTIGPGVNMAGNVYVGDGAYIGIGASIREKIKIGANSVIGGGAFVKDDVPAQALYAGVPAVFKKWV